MHVGCAIDLPAPQVMPELGRRRHRRITGPAGAILFACMFLPAVKGCGSPVYPIEAPMFLPPYLFGLAFAACAGVWTTRGMRHAIRGLRAVTLLAIAGSAVTLLLAPPVGVVELFAGVAVLAVIGWSGHSERRAALAAMVVGALCTMWFGLWSCTREALIGVYLATAGSVGLLAGAVVWLLEATPATVETRRPKRGTRRRSNAPLDN